VHKAISVIKKRTGKHERTIREVNMDRGKIRVGRPLTNFRGIFTGTPEQSAARSRNKPEHEGA
jgi:circadian clock protein KaiC